MSPSRKSSSNDAPIPSPSSHPLSAPSSSTRSHKSSSVYPTATNGSPPRTQLSSPVPIQTPLQNYSQQLVRRFSRHGSTSNPSIDPARASDPEKITTSGFEERPRRRQSQSRNLDSPRNTRRASYTSAILRSLGDMVPNTGGTEMNNDGKSSHY